MAGLIGDDHYRKKRNERSEKQAVNENNVTGFLQIRQLGVFDFPVNLSHRLEAAHSQDRVAESDENTEQPNRLRQAAPAQPSQRVGRKM